LAAILLVEDNDDVREMMSLALQLDGHSVRAAVNGRDALTQLRGGLRPCLILMDLMMPEMNGWELRAALRADPAWRDIPVVVISAVNPETAERLQSTTYLPKPIDIDNLLEMVCTHCRGEADRAAGGREPI
jgi:CheY-like chemotaxis protein